MNQVADRTVPIELYDSVRVASHPEWGTGEVLKIAQNLGVYQAKVLFRSPDGERLETVPLEWLEKSFDVWQRFAAAEYDDARPYRLKQMAYDMAYANTGGELTASRVDLLPHQILLVHHLVGQSPRRMLIRELIARGDAERIPIVTPTPWAYG